MRQRRKNKNNRKKIVKGGDNGNANITYIAQMVAEAYVNTLLSLYEGEGLNQLLNIECDYTENVIDLTDSVCAYSIRRLTPSYVGYAIGVQSTSSSNIINIPFTSDGLLDTDYLTTVSNNVSLYVTIWYDQSGNNYNLTIPFSNAPVIIDSSGNITMVNNLPAIEFKSSKETAFTSSINIEAQNMENVSMYSVFKTTSTNTSTLIPIFKVESSENSEKDNNLTLVYTGQYDDPEYILYTTSEGTGLDSLPISTDSDYSLTFIQYFQNSNEKALVVNNITEKDSTDVGVLYFDINSTITLGNDSDRYYDGYIQEIIFYNKKSTTDSRNSIVNNINNYYGLSSIFSDSSSSSSSGSNSYISTINKLPSEYYNACVADMKKKGYDNDDIRTICDYHKKCDVSYIELGQDATLDVTQVASADAKSIFISMLKSAFIQEAYNSGDSFDSGDLFDSDSGTWDDIYAKILDFSETEANTFLEAIQEAIIDQYVQVRNGRTAGSISLQVLADLTSSQLMSDDSISKILSDIDTVITQETEVTEAGLSELIMWIIYIILIIVVIILAGFVIYLIFQYYTLYVGT